VFDEGLGDGVTVGEEQLLEGGELPDGRTFKDSAAFKQLLLADRDAVAKAFVEHLCTYALRRVLTFDDKADIDAIVAEAKKRDYRLQEIVKAVATSEILRKR
ncbi:MAG: DUF1585 domain-containing protein, partial [Verrucomicrobiota bacterium]